MNNQQNRASSFYVDEREGMIEQLEGKERLTQ